MLVLWLFSFCVAVFAFRSPYPKGNPSKITGDVGEKLFLTPYIEANEIEKARKLAEVPPLTGNVISYSGYLTVNKTCQSNMFIWFFPAQSKDPNAPLAIWLQGGPGATSLYGLFSELGPYELTRDNEIRLRKYSWAQDASYVFIDNPVGTGYSFTDGCYAKNEVDVGRDLLNALKQILKLFPEYKNNPLFLTGESYAGKYVPAFAYAIHKDKDPNQTINLQGLAIGNGFIDPVNQLMYSDYLYHIGLLDPKDRDVMKDMEKNCLTLIQEEKWLEAYSCFDSLLNGDFQTYKTYFTNVTGFNYYFNFLYSDSEPQGDLTPFVTQDNVRKSIHVGNATWSDGTDVGMALMADVMQSVRPWLEELLEHYRVLIYNGQLDIIVAYPLTEGYLQKLNWSAKEEYKNATRSIWRVDNEVAGYAKSAGKLTDVLVRNAGHMVPMNQPKWSLDMIYRFFKNKPFN